MFDAGTNPRLFAMPPGADFPAALVAGCLDLTRALPPDALARTTIYVNTRRMQRRVRALFSRGEARLLPSIRLITEVGRDTTLVDVPLSVTPLRRRLDLSRLVAKLIAADPTLAPETAVFDLADSLASLMDEMQGEGVSMNAIAGLDVSDASGHWARAQSFLAIVGQYLATEGSDAPDPEARQRMAVERLAEIWATAPPEDPVIVAGSTGSRGTTLAFMKAVAALPQGAIVLPGFDWDMPGEIWDQFAAKPLSEDHPQFRFAKLFDALDTGPSDVRLWPGAEAPSPDRNKLVSLALRPAPVTNQWLTDGPALGDLTGFTQGLTLIEARSPRSEAQAIAYLLRSAAEDGRTAALVTPDRMLTRRVSALLDRWGIEPDDSAGRPLALTPPGRLLRQVAALIETGPTLDTLLSLLKHPLVHVGDGRSDHLRHTRDLELWLRRKGIPWPGSETLTDWDGAPASWMSWLAGILTDGPQDGPSALATMVAHHLDMTARLVSGQGSENSAALWDKPAGKKAAEVMADLQREADHADPISARDYALLLRRLFDQVEVRDPGTPHPKIMIWGTLEARVQGADLVILAGLNEGTWPEAPAPDPWLNRRMRAEAGLLLPERRIGLSAHDFQQAIAAPEAILTRAVRDDTAQPVPSRWLNRLTNLLDGLGDTGGPEALKAMRDRGNQCLILSESLDRPDVQTPPECRPSPCPPVNKRPRRLSFTEVERLIRDPYAIYARHVLRLRKLDPLRPEPDARVKGRILHDIFDRFMMEWRDKALIDPRAHLMAVAEDEIAKAAPWPMSARLLQAQIDRVADWFIETEAKRSESAEFLGSELKGSLTFDPPGFTLHGRADRMDQLHDGRVVILDYKSGTPPTANAMEYFDVQLLLEALIAEGGGFEGQDAAIVESVGHIGIGSTPTRTSHAMVDGDEQKFDTRTVRKRLLKLIAAYDSLETGYTARRAMQKMRFEGDFDHLARFGEWDDSDMPTGITVG